MTTFALGGAGVGGCGSDATQPEVTVGPPSGLAVIGSDFTSSEISLVTATGEVAKDDCFDSGTKAEGKLSLALSGDVTLPSQQQRGRQLWVIDRGNAALTVLAPTDCAVQAQISVATGFKSNPHDVAVLADDKAYVTRYEKNIAPADADSTGDDILIIDPTSGAITGRIDLSTSATAVAGAAIQARPDRMVIAGGKVYVSLGNQDAKFLTAADGRVVVIDPETDKVTGTIDLTGLKDCSALFYLQSENLLLVSCGGSFADADQAVASGVAAIDLQASPPALAHVVKASALGGQPVNFSWVAAVSSASTFASTLGAFPDPAHGIVGSNDEAFAFDLGSSAATSFGIAAGAFSIGRAALAGTTLFVPDADAKNPRVHVFDTTRAPTPAETATFNPDAAKGLPPREIAWY